MNALSPQAAGRYAWHRLFSLTRAYNKNLSSSDTQGMACSVLLAALAIPPYDETQTEGEAELQRERSARMASILGIVLVRPLWSLGIRGQFASGPSSAHQQDMHAAGLSSKLMVHTGAPDMSSTLPLSAIGSNTSPQSLSLPCNNPCLPCTNQDLRQRCSATWYCTWRRQA